LALEVRASLEVVLDLAGDDGDVGAESFGGQCDLDELDAVAVSGGAREPLQGWSPDKPSSAP